MARSATTTRPRPATGHCTSEYGIEVPIGPWRERRRIRVSVQGYNTRADLERLVGALAALIDPDAMPA